MSKTLYPFYKDNKMDVVRGVTVLFCGRCEKEFLAKIKEGQNDPTYECPKCKTANKFPIQWKPLT